MKLTGVAYAVGALMLFVCRNNRGRNVAAVRGSERHVFVSSVASTEVLTLAASMVRQEIARIG